MKWLRFLLLFCFLAGFSSACQNDTQERKQNPIREDGQIQDLTQIGPPPIRVAENSELRNQLQSNDINTLLSLLTSLETLLFSKEASDPQIFTQDIYRDQLDIYLSLSKKLFNQFESSHSKIFQSWNQLDQILLQPCIQRSDCSLMYSVFSQDHHFLFIIDKLIEQKTENREKLAYIEISFDLAGNRREKALQEKYINTILELAKAKDKEDSNDQIDQKFIRSLNNILNQLSFNFLIDTPDEKLTYIKKIEPWRFSSTKNSFLNSIRKKLVMFLPKFIDNDSDLLKVISDELKSLLDEKTKANHDLKSYPAFKDINLDHLAKEPFIGFFVSKLFFGELALSEFNDAYDQVKDKSFFLDTAFEQMKLLIRWQIAQNSIKSTQKLSEIFNARKVKSKSFFQQVLIESHQVVKIWTQFHNRQKKHFRSFFDSNKADSSKLTQDIIYDFYNSIDRTILKTTVYPNMMAFLHDLSKEDWVAEIRIYGNWKRTFETVKLYDELLSGALRKPWFILTDLKNIGLYSRNDEDRVSLLRSEILDSFYYFFTTKTHQAYGIGPDDFLYTLGNQVTKKRKTLFEKVLKSQDIIYFDNTSDTSRFLRWCQKIKDKKFTSETIPFEDLSHHLLEFGMIMDTPKEHLSDSGKPKPLYFQDLYKLVGIPSTSRVDSINDRFRLEYLPIINRLKRFKKIYENLTTQSPSLKLPEISRFKNLLTVQERMAKIYLGAQVTITSKIGDCKMEAHDESYRRAREVVNSEKYYLEKIVYPALKRFLVDKNISILKVNREINKMFSQYQEGMRDEIKKAEDGNYSLHINLVSYMLRVRWWLKYGIKDHKNINGEILNLPPILGEYSFISQPTPDYLNPEKVTSYIHNHRWISRVPIPLDPNDSAEEFSAKIISRLSDQPRGTGASGEDYAMRSEGKFSHWDYYDTGKFAEGGQLELSFYSHLYQLGSFEYSDYSKEYCRNPSIKLSKSCLLDSDKTGVTESIDKLGLRLKRWFEVVELNEDELDYLSIINEHSLFSKAMMNLVLKYESEADDPGLYLKNEAPFHELAGFYDLLYRYLDSNYLGQAYFFHSDPAFAKADPDLSCVGQRDGCFWENEREDAREFFYSRIERPGLLFNFDMEIIKDDYSYVRERINNKYDRLIDLNKKSEEYFDRAWGDKDDLITIHTEYKRKFLVKPLNDSYTHAEDDAEDFYGETGNIFIETPDWTEFATKYIQK